MLIPRAARLRGHLHFVESSREAAQADNLQCIYSDMLKEEPLKLV